MTKFAAPPNIFRNFVGMDELIGRELEELARMRRRFGRWRLAIVLFTCVIIGGYGLKVWFDVRAERERRRIELEAAEWYWERRKHAMKRQQLQVFSDDEFERYTQQAEARIDLIMAAGRAAPSYTIEEVHKMVRSRVPNYSDIELWRLNNDKWLMRYRREYGGKCHCFYQRFNPTTKEFAEPIEYSTYYYRDYAENPIYTKPKNMRCSYKEDTTWGMIEYYEDGVWMGRYDRRGIEEKAVLKASKRSPMDQACLRALRNAPEEWEEEGYESREDWLYDNADDFREYYR